MALSGVDGAFQLVVSEAGADTLVATRLGYEKLTRPMQIVAGESMRLVVEIHTESLAMPELEVLAAAAEAEERSHGHQSAVELSGRDLRERMGPTIASTLASEPGLAEESMGPAPARPVLRGLAGNRLVFLDDGVPTGDLSAASADHAVAIDPLGAERVEVIRGPATLLYGSAIQGGTINIHRDYVLDRHPSHWTASLGLVGDTVSQGRAAQAKAAGPVGPVGFVATGIVREAEDVETPVGSLGNSGISTWNAAVGAGVAGGWGHAGVAARRYESDYEIPGGFLGGHKNGADIELELSGLDGRAALEEVSGLDRLEFRGRYSRYFHKELEANDVCGVSFGLLEYHGGVRAIRSTRLGNTTLGLSLDTRDYAQGCLSFVPRTDEISLAGVAYHEVRIGRFDVHGAVRFDDRSVEPEAERDNKAGRVRRRDYSGTSGAISASTPLGAGFSTRLMLIRSFRAPSLEELFSDGPHLASFAYEVGNADLGSEIGQGVDWTLRWDRNRSVAWLSLFHNDYDRFIHVADTGELEFGPGESGFLSRWQYRGLGATLSGAELEVAWKPRRWVDLEFTGSYVRGTLTGSEEPLPRIPPFSGRVAARFHWGAWHASMALRGAAEQGRLATFEERTAGYVTADVGLEWGRLGGTAYQTIMLRVQNLANVEYRNHLSRIKSIMPQPGRNVSLLLRVELF